MKNNINLESLMKVILMICIPVIMIYAVITGKMQNFVNPRLNVVIIMAAVIMISAGIFMIPDVIHPKHSVYLKPYFLIAVPIIIAMIFPSGYKASADFLDLNNNSYVKEEKSTVKKDNSGNTEKDESNKYIRINEPIFKGSSVINVTDEDYAKWYLKVSGDMDNYEGQKVKIKAQFFKSKDFKENEFVPARMAMVCCVADLQPCGFLCRYDKANDFTTDQWIYVTGTIHIERYEGEKMPIIYADKVEKAPAAKEKYIYFNGNY